MTTLFYILMVLAPVALFATAFIAVKNRFSGKSIKKPLKMNIAVFAVLVVLISVLCVNVFAAEAPSASNDAAAVSTEAQAESQNVADNSKGLGLLAAGLVTGLAGIGGGIAVAAGAPAAIAATAENPKSFGKSIIFVALGESIALYGVVISILILNKI
ncbi:MAG: ATP synthase subunit C [Ruminococcus sp.]|nr:ATP synthase subunit C [Ruminococcus sp.]MDY4908751.1 ATP synthase subunit C [Candidatus Fimenecus sp.]